ncbi:MAG: DUF4177 domain-containing protein [Atribacterota bacterium]
MKDNLSIKIILIIIGIMFGLNLIQFFTPNSQTSYAAKNVEYKVIDAQNMAREVLQIELFLNELGKEGWELVQAEPYAQLMIFKR